MSEISAKTVMALREKTGQPMMECKKALQECGGDESKAVVWLREKGAKVQATRTDRETSEGRIAAFTGAQPPVAAMIELLCESAPVANSADFAQLAADLAQQLATGPGAKTPEELLAQTSPSKLGMTLNQQKDDLFNRIREVFNVKRIMRCNSTCGKYVHHDHKTGVLVEYTGGNADLANGIATHVAAMNPAVLKKEDLDAAVVAKEREILLEAARKEGKPANILDKMVEGRMRNFYAEQVLTEQPYVKEDGKRTVGAAAAEADMKLVRFVRWQVGKE